MKKITRYDSRLILDCPSELTQAIDAAATARLQKRSEYLRRVLTDRVEADGIALDRHG